MRWQSKEEQPHPEISFEVEVDASEAGVIQQLSTLTTCLEDIKAWMKLNFLQLNSSKTEAILVGTPHQVSTSTITSISFSESFYLGVKMDPHLTYDTHIQQLCKTSFYHLRNIAKHRPLLTLADAEKLVHVFVSSRLDYCNALLIGIPSKSIQKLQYVQNSAARILMRVRKFNHITPILKTLHWLPVSLRIEYKVSLLTHQCLHGTAPTYSFRLNSPASPLIYLHGRDIMTDLPKGTTQQTEHHRLGLLQEIVYWRSQPEVQEDPVAMALANRGADFLAGERPLSQDYPPQKACWDQDSSDSDAELITLHLTSCDPVEEQEEQVIITEGQEKQAFVTEGQEEQAIITEGEEEQAIVMEGQEEQAIITEGEEEQATVTKGQEEQAEQATVTEGPKEQMNSIEGQGSAMGTVDLSCKKRKSEGPRHMPKRKKLQKNCSYRTCLEAFPIRSVVRERVRKGKAEILVDWEPCPICGKEWAHSWQPKDSPQIEKK
ncbi:uncharacterized protein [Paramormyrops kingsleyae]|uniref:uncharacterized protein n=1 Tax=Paramormyrops kingsleyae TaxID=1676925 RepID=UPI003B970863